MIKMKDVLKVGTSHIVKLNKRKTKKVLFK